MGLTQPVFPQVDKLGRTMDRNEFEAVTNRDDENITSYEGASLMQQTQRSRKPFQQINTMADLAMIKQNKKTRRQLSPIKSNISSVPAVGIKMRKQSLPKPLGVSSPGMSSKKFGIKKRSVNAQSSRNDTNSGFNAMNSTHMTVSDAVASNQRLASHKNDSIFRATEDSSYLNENSQKATYRSQKQQTLRVVTMDIDESYETESNANEGNKRMNRLTIYRAQVIPDS